MATDAPWETVARLLREADTVGVLNDILLHDFKTLCFNLNAKVELARSVALGATPLPQPQSGEGPDQDNLGARARAPPRRRRRPAPRAAKVAPPPPLAAKSLARQPGRSSRTAAGSA
jgi:hypothetical protein